MPEHAGMSFPFKESYKKEMERGVYDDGSGIQYPTLNLLYGLNFWLYGRSDILYTGRLESNEGP